MQAGRAGAQGKHAGLDVVGGIACGKGLVKRGGNRLRDGSLHRGFLDKRKMDVATGQRRQIVLPARIAGFLDVPAQDRHRCLQLGLLAGECTTQRGRAALGLG